MVIRRIFALTRMPLLLKLKLPSNEIKRLELEECQICYANGTVSTYQGKNEIDFELEEFTYAEQE